MKFKLAAFADGAESSIGEQISAMRENDAEYIECRDEKNKVQAMENNDSHKTLKERWKVRW